MIEIPISFLMLVLGSYLFRVAWGVWRKPIFLMNVGVYSHSALKIEKGYKVFFLFAAALLISGTGSVIFIEKFSNWPHLLHWFELMIL